MTACRSVDLCPVEDDGLGLVSKISILQSSRPQWCSLTSVKQASVAATPAADGKAAPGEESAGNAVDIIFILPFPVASAIMLPPPLKFIMLSSRSGTVTKAKDPARAIIRGNAMTKSFGERFIKDVLLDIEDILR